MRYYLIHYHGKRMDLGTLITRELTESGMTQKQLAEALGRSAQYINDIIQNRRNIPIDTAEQIAVALDIPCDVVCGAAKLLPKDIEEKLALADATQIQRAFAAMRSRLDLGRT